MAEIHVKALKQKDGSILVEFPINNYSTQYMKVDGKITSVPRVATFSSLTSNIIPLVHTQEILIGYRHHMNTDLVIPVLEYQEKEKEFLAMKFYNLNDHVYVWNNIDDEFEYRKFVATWNHKVYEKVEEIVGSYILDIEDMRYSENKYIRPMRHYGEKITENIFKFEGLIAVMDYIHEIAKELGYTYIDEINKRGEAVKEMEYSYPSHSGIDFLKISGNYVYGSSSNTKYSFRTVIGTYEECQKAFEENYNNLKSKFLMDLNKRKTIDKILASSILNQVKSIRSHINKIDSKVSTRTEYNLALKQSLNLINKLESYIIDKKVEF